MNKAEKFIEENTKDCTNKSLREGEYYLWLTPSEAKRAVEIAREETIEKVCEWLKKNVTYTHPRKGTEECIINLGKLKDAMRHE